MIDQMARKTIEGTGVHWEQQEENLRELVHDENDYAIPETVVKRLRQCGEDPTKWNQLTQAEVPPSKESVFPASTIKPEGKEQLDQMSTDNDDKNPYETVGFKRHTPSKTNDSSGEEAELVSIDPPAPPLQPSPISAVKDEESPPYRDSSMGDPSIPHTKPNHAEESSMDKDETSSVTEELPIKLQVSAEDARE